VSEDRPEHCGPNVIEVKDEVAAQGLDYLPDAQAKRSEREQEEKAAAERSERSDQVHGGRQQASLRKSQVHVLASSLWS
jgi:hypothetical protein